MTDEKLKHILHVLAKEQHERSAVDLKEIWRMVSNIPFFNQIVLKDENLTDGDYISLARRLTAITVPAGDYVFQQGQKTNAMYVVLSGRLTVIKALGLNLISATIQIRNSGCMHKREASSPITKKHTDSKQVWVKE